MKAKKGRKSYRYYQALERKHRNEGKAERATLREAVSKPLALKDLAASVARGDAERKADKRSLRAYRDKKTLQGGLPCVI
tara:strand:+ start:125 stop:364 length:240 start_codon:yes stop_codon:yes gene_type:complete